MKAPTAKQSGFFDPVFGLALFALMSLSATTIETAHSADSHEAQQQLTCAETDLTVVQKDFQCH